jgi:hypothetical protein
MTRTAQCCLMIPELASLSQLGTIHRDACTYGADLLEDVALRPDTATKEMHLRFQEPYPPLPREEGPT